MQAGTLSGYEHASNAVWLELVHEMLNMGLVEEAPRASADAEASARVVCITPAGVEELQRIQSVLQQQNQQASSESSPKSAPLPVTSRLRTRRLATQALTLYCAGASHQVAIQVCTCDITSVSLPQFAQGGLKSVP